MNKKISLILIFLLICSLTPVSSFAAGAADYSLIGNTVKLTGSDATVEIPFSSVAGGNFYSLEGDWSKNEIGDTSYIKLSALTAGGTASATENSADTGRIVWMDTSFSAPITVAAGGTVWTATYTIDKDTPAGDYTVSFDVKAITDSTYYSDTSVGKLTATIKVTREEADGYTVTLSSDAPSAGVAKGSSFNVNLDVDNSEVTAFNAFYSILTYDSTKVSYTGEKTAGYFTVNTSETGKLKITRTGSDVEIVETPELTLPFQAVAAGEAVLELTKAKVDSKANAETQDAPDATVSGSPLTVKVLETYTITFAGGDGATGTAPTMDPAVEGHKFALPEAGDLKKDGFTFSGWNDGTDNYKAGAEYTMPAKDVTFTAQWTENVTVTPASANPSAYFGSQYKLIAATINASGYIPTYDGNEMFLVQGYEDNTYYYVIDGTYDSSKFSYKEGTATTIAKPDYDVNQTKLVDINDAQFVYNIYNGISPTQNIVQRLLLADTNRDQTVGTQDCAVVVQNIA